MITLPMSPNCLPIFSATKFMRILLLLFVVNCKLLYLIRHAEKPYSKHNPNLNNVGFKRAECIAHIFTSKYQEPKQIIAQGQDSRHKSKRSIQTVKPLAKALHLKIETCASRDIACAQDLINKSKGPILISWEHKRLRKIMEKFVENPPKYPRKRFDLIWIVDTVKGTLEEHTQDCKLDRSLTTDYLSEFQEFQFNGSGITACTNLFLGLWIVFLNILVFFYSTVCPIFPLVNYYNVFFRI